QPTRGLFIFRGVGNANHRLMPAAFRPDRELFLPPRYVQPPLRTVVGQCSAELNTLWRFFEIASRHGLRLPEDSQALRSELQQWRSRLTCRGSLRRVRGRPL